MKLMIRLYSSNVLAKYALIFAYDTCSHNIPNIEYLYDHNIPFFDVFLTKDEKKNIKVIVPSDGSYELSYGGFTICLTVSSLVTAEKKLLQDREHSDIIKELLLTVINSPTESEANSILIDFVNTAKDYVERKLNDLKDQRTDTITKYVYNIKFNDWETLNICPKRSMDSVFLNKKDKEKLLTVINEFVDPNTQKEYHMYSIPYKCNIMLYGKQGTGKTSTIHAIASHISADIYIIQFTRCLDDAALTHAFNNITVNDRFSKKRKVIIMEDVDCIFENRKEHDTSRNSITLSGFLNVLDGMTRANGLIVFLTTNKISAIDKAVLRPCRMDLIMSFSDVKEEQIHEMFNLYIPDQKHRYSDFFKLIEFKKVTTSMLQQFLFTHRRSSNICDHIEDFYSICSSSSPAGAIGTRGEDGGECLSLYT